MGHLSSELCPGCHLGVDCKTLRVGKVVVKAGLRWPLGVGLMLQDLAFLAVWFQVKDKLRLDRDKLSKSVSSVLHHSA